MFAISTKDILSIILLLCLNDSASAFAPSSVTRFQKTSEQYRPLSVSVSELEEVNEGPDIDSPPLEDYIVNIGDLEGEDEEDGIEDDGEPPIWYESHQRMQALREMYRRSENDTGSPEYQVAGMTERISYLTKHLKIHPKDFSTRRGLVAMVNKRRRLLNYLSKREVERYKSLIKSLGIRHKAPGAVPSKSEKYGRFPKQKAVKKHLVKRKK
eukprot:CAMPEP_0194162578 /NCGR_PEP_ID=MMETSP0152-20130528/79571_1 /TAXON_ID=1049557 /ORGANISM="Thalassiothrix antarctica, Strain L6-D1" /LENGTH=211 /DNA_ID=CAMNT_0038872483 /DNA_START=724 /DNA_END=1359 /DNA_ORIENTATION=-